MRFDKLPDWLGWLEQQHPKTIDLGLERISDVARRLGVRGFDATVITVAGTNGKGSFVCAMDALLRAHGKRVATYTSPHLLTFNERIRIDGKLVSDESLLRALDKVDQACQGVSLSYFEFTTLAAFTIFASESLDFIVLEVGLGGRLDAVNIIDADIAVITSIGLDHQEYLGESLDDIATEKCGILRPDSVFICAESASVGPLKEAIDKHASYVINRFFSVSETDREWTMSAPRLFDGQWVFPMNGLSTPSQAAAVVCLHHLLGEKIELVRIHSALDGLSLAGRYQRFNVDGVSIILDVAHNEQAVSMLRERLDRTGLPVGKKRIAVFNMLADKDVDKVIDLMKNRFDAWFLAEIDNPRAMKGMEVAERLSSASVQKVSCSRNARQALARALSVSKPGDQIVAFGSFYIVSALLPRLGQYE